MKHHFKYICVWLSMYGGIGLGAQPMPADSTLLKTLYGAYDVGGASFTRMLQPWENIAVEYDSIVYKVVFKQVIKLQAKDFLLVCTAAATSAPHHHHLGYWASYAFKSMKGQWVKDHTWYTDTNQIRVLGDDTLRYKLVNIGKNKKALIETWESRGNLHFQKNIEVLEIGTTQIKEQGSIQIGFSNVDWEAPSMEGDCIAESIEGTYEILPSSKEWFDIRIHKKYYTYGKYCKDKVLDKTENLLWVHTDQGYTLKEINRVPIPKTK